mgnify:CR=1 FL=1
MINKKNGKWKFYDQRGALQRVQSFTDDIPNGKWISYYPNGKKQNEGSYSMLKKEGIWSFYDENGDVTYRVEYTNGEISKTLIDKRKKQ